MENRRPCKLLRSEEVCGGKKKPENKVGEEDEENDDTVNPQRKLKK